MAKQKMDRYTIAKKGQICPNCYRLELTGDFRPKYGPSRIDEQDIRAD
jgi:hypothetical protein